MGPKKNFPCILCQKQVQDGISCSICNRWVHKDCVDESIYKLVIEVHTKFGSHFWSCEGCSLGLTNLQKRVSAQETQIKELTSVVKVVQADNNQNKSNIAENKSNISDNKDRISKIEELVKESQQVDNNNQDAIKELDERARKQKNLILHGVTEQDENLSSDQRKKLDTDVITEIIQSSTLSSVEMKRDVKFIVRIGERKEGKKRPICIGFRNVITRDDVLDTVNLEVSHPDYSLSPDLTKIQLTNERKLKDEAKKNNDELSEEDAKKYVWKPVGQYGHRKLIKSIIKPQRRERITSTKRTAEEMEETQDLATRSKTRKQY